MKHRPGAQRSTASAPPAEAEELAALIDDGFVGMRRRFLSVTRRATERFEQRDWHGMQADATERLDVYAAAVDRLEDRVREMLGDRVGDRDVWAAARRCYVPLIAGYPDREKSETFFNSLTRRIFGTVGVDDRIEFVAPPVRPDEDHVFRSYPLRRDLAETIRAVLRDLRFQVAFADSRGDALATARAIEAEIEGRELDEPVRIDVADQVFFRGTGAYAIGRVVTSSGELVPLAIAIHHGPRGLSVSAVLPTFPDLSILFSYAQTSFHVLTEKPGSLVAFLHTILPEKRIHEIYTAIGYSKHGKTELYRDIMSYVAATDDEFVPAPGTRGMVMLVFTMPGYDQVFKIIRDRFPFPKQTTPSQVKEKYRLVFRHDRAGRLIDATEFEQLRFDRRLFSAELLEELERDATSSVTVADDDVVVHHCYVERKVSPLDIYVRTAEPDEAVRAILDYGRAIKNLAASNIFPGDMLLKNFGVTRRNRAVFYDYDELTLLTDCTFREIPEATHPEDELSADPWFGVAEGDVFPEQFRRFLGVPRWLREEFEQRHGDLFGVEFWSRIQERIRSGETIEIFPFRPARRLTRERRSATTLEEQWSRSR